MAGFVTFGTAPIVHDNALEIADAIINRAGKKIVLVLPLGLGKANQIVDALEGKKYYFRRIVRTR